MTQPATDTPAPATTPRNMALPCPNCGNEQASMSLHLASLEDGDAVTCNECNAEFSLDLMRQVARKWAKLVAWIDAAPDLDD